MTTLTDRATPRPWRLSKDSDEYGGDVIGPDGEYVAVDHEGLVPCVRSGPDAALIVRAVNAHDDLVGLLREVRSCGSRPEARRFAGVIGRIDRFLAALDAGSEEGK